MSLNATLVVATFPDRASAERAAAELQAGHIDSGAIKLLTPESDVEKHQIGKGPAEEPVTGPGASIGTVAGAALGGLATGALPGMVVLGLAGGLVGALTDLGASESVVSFAENEVRARPVCRGRAGGKSGQSDRAVAAKQRGA